jgi:hypothetical protein
MNICRYSLFELVVVTEPPVIRNKFVEVFEYLRDCCFVTGRSPVFAWNMA